MPVLNLLHYTDKVRWNAIRAQRIWRFKASQPKDPDRPKTTYERSISGYKFPKPSKNVFLNLVKPMG